MPGKDSKKSRSKKPKLSKQDKELQQHIDQLRSDLQRLQADFINYRRRSEEDHALAASFGREAAVTAMLPVVDNLQRALENVPTEMKDSDFVKGIKSISKQFLQILSDMGIEPIECLGKPFDADTMDAVHMENGKGEREIVDEEIQTGYRSGERILRHAVVKVTKK